MFRESFQIKSARGSAFCSLVAVVAPMLSSGCDISRLLPAPNPIVVNDNATVTPTPEPTVKPEDPVANEPVSAKPGLYVANNSGNNVIGFANPSQADGNVLPDTVLAGPQTELSGPSDLLVNSTNQLLVTNLPSRSITTYNEADTVQFDVKPDGNLQGEATLLIGPLVGPTSLALNADEDLLFAANLGFIAVFEFDLNSSLDGNKGPIRIIRGSEPFNPFKIDFAANDELYVLGNNVIRVYASASSIQGPVVPDRTIDSASFEELRDVFVDEFDTMYVVDAADRVHMFFDASALNGTIDPDRTLELPSGEALAIAVDRFGTAYIIDATNDAIYSYDDITILNGVVEPHRTIQGSNTFLSAPTGIFLVE